MSTFDNAFDPSVSLNSSGCSCGRHTSQAEHDRDAPRLQCVAVETEEQHARDPARRECIPVETDEKHYEKVLASAVMRVLFPKDVARRGFLRSVGSSTALAALSQFFPLKTATDVFASGGPIEKKDLKVGFIPITCGTPIIMAQPMGFYAKHGLNVEVMRAACWAVIRAKTLNKEYDAAHMLSPMPLAITLGAGSQPIAYTAPA